MSSKKRNIAVVFNEQGAAELSSILRLWMRNGDVFGPFVYCKEVSPDGVYLQMTIEDVREGQDPILFEVQVHHSHVRAIFCAADLKRIGFAPQA